MFAWDNELYNTLSCRGMSNNVEFVMLTTGLIESSYSDLVNFNRFLDRDRDILSEVINFTTIKKAEVEL